jgi:Skp family chaperone for outer membrane proteins
MKLALVLATLALVAPIAHAGKVIPGFFDVQKAMADSAEGKKNAADEKADFDKKQAEVTKEVEDWKKAKAACDKTRPDPTSLILTTGKSKDCKEQDRIEGENAGLRQRYQDDITQHQQADAQRLLARVNRILPVIAKAKHLGALVPLGGVFYADSALDMTAEVTRRLDAGEGKDPAATAEENARLKAEIDRLRAENAALTKPAPPSIPPPPPIQPAHVAKK